jgi:uncharacterized protein (DUF608 family)
MHLLLAAVSTLRSIFIPVFICNVLADGLSDRKRLSTIFQWFLHVEKSLPVYVFYFYRFLWETIKVFLKKIQTLLNNFKKLNNNINVELSLSLNFSLNR